MSDNNSIHIGAGVLDTAAIVAEIRARVAERRERGEYDEAAIARAERHNLSNLKDDEQFLERYLSCLRQATQVDINDFEIVERRAYLAPLLRRIKRAIWGLLRFYTFRLWSQQNEINGLLLAATEIVATRDQEKIAALESRVHELEKRLKDAGRQP